MILISYHYSCPLFLGLDSLNHFYHSSSLWSTYRIEGELDPFVPIGNKIKPTDDDFAKADKVAAVLQECVDYADGDSNVFTDELKRRIN